jgi:hypothetical protein
MARIKASTKAERRDVKRTYSIDEVADLLGVGRNSAYAAAGRDFPIITIGKRKVAPKAAIDRMLGIDGAPEAA